MKRSPHPALFFALFLPYGTSFGYISVAFVTIASTKGGLTQEQAGTVVAAAYVPHVFKFLWAPVVDTTLTKKAWYLIALALVVLGTIASTSIPIDEQRLPLLTSVMMASQVGLTLLGMACENFLAYNVALSEKGRAAGWHQAGAIFGSGVGGGAALWLYEHLPAGWMVGAVLGVAMLACALPLLALREPPPMGHGLPEAMRGLGRDIKGIVLSRTGILGLIICFSPVGAGAATVYFGPNVAAWGGTLRLVEIVTGAIGGIVAAVGAVAGGWFADRVGRRNGYAIGGGLTALTAIAMALSPHAPWSYVLFTLTYSFFNGVAAAGFTGLVLETIGVGAAATKYNIFASLSNIANGYCIKLDGKAQTRWGANGMFLADAVLTFGGIAALLALSAVLRRLWPAADRAEGEAGEIS